MKKSVMLQVKSEKLTKGFTLIELLVVIAIIGILATLLMSNFIGIRQRARDGKRKSDVAQIQAALEQYRADNGSYPSSIPSCGSAFVNPVGCTIGSSGCLVYMQKVPCDPLSGQTYYNGGSYYYKSDNVTYTLGACLENTSDPQSTSTSPDNNGANPPCSSSAYYVVNNP